MKLLESLIHTPVVLSFGTSGLRGLVKDMTDLECYINTAGFLQFLVQSDDLKPGETVYVAGDLRRSTPRIMRAVTAAINDAGYKAVNCGLIPTPALAFYAIGKGQPSIMVSGSHIPADRNGIKFYKRAGEVLKEDESGIHLGVHDIREKLYQSDHTTSKFDRDGNLRDLPELDVRTSEAEASYKHRYLDVFANDVLAGKTIVVYQQSAVARDLLVEILRALGAEVLPIERSDEFVPIDTDKITEDEKKQFQGFATAHPGAFAIISADGDSDRPIVIDERGNFQWGDLLGAIVADFLGIKFAASVVSANDAIDEACESRAITLVKTKIGSPYVISAMSAAPPEKRPAAAWEMNGGFLLGNDIKLDKGTLRALPTRDAMLPILACLVSAARAQLSVSELFARLPQRFLAAGLIDGVPEVAIAAFRSQSSDSEKMKVLVEKLFPGNELGELVDMNLTDGLRLKFSSGDVVHFRPSGNAPQFRIYTTANSQQRADELADAALASDGYIARLLKLFG